MTTPSEDYRQIAGRFTELVAGADPARWGDPAPCEGWTARDVVRHLVTWFPGFLKHGAGVELAGGPDVDDDPYAAWTAMSDQVQALLDDPASEEISYTGPPGTFALPHAIAMFFTGDVFLHTWDLARATGQDETLDADRCAAMLAGMEPIDELLRSSGHYGPKQPVAPDADAQTRLLAFIGRTV
jgi:uncharacterized protein (TIGR03086 family)